MQTIALTGGTGATGKLFLEKALEAGHKVKTLARSPQKVEIEHENLEVIKGDVLKPEDVDRLVKGSEVVVSLFGHVKGSPADLQTRGTQNLVRAMKNHGLSRIISLSGGGLPFPEKDQPKLADKMIRGIMKVVASKMLSDAENHAEVLRKSGLGWTIVRGPRLTNQPEKGDYRVGWVGVNASTKIGRADLADFILKVMENKSHVKEMPFVSY